MTIEQRIAQLQPIASKAAREAAAAFTFPPHIGAEDLEQEATIAIWRAIEGRDNQSAEQLAALAKTAARRAMSNMMRDQCAQKRSPDEPLHLGATDEARGSSAEGIQWHW